MTFFWFLQVNRYIYGAVADCTGHGVPGALMSMLCISSLNEIISEKNMISPAEVLNEMRKRIIKSLHQQNSLVNSRDGVDIALTRLDLKTNILEYAGAHTPVYIARNNHDEYELLELKPDRMPVGIHPRSNIPFMDKQLQLKVGDRLYYFSDGIATQFGSEKNVKFSTARLKQTILDLQNLPISEHEAELNKVIDNWMVGYQQIDDIILIGFELTAELKVGDKLKQILAKRKKRNMISEGNEMSDINEKIAFLLKQFARQYNEENSKDEIVEYLDMLYEEIMKGFEIELKLAEDNNTGRAAELNIIHQDFIERIKQYKSQLDTSATALDDMVVYIFDWLVVHH